MATTRSQVKKRFSPYRSAALADDLTSLTLQCSFTTINPTTKRHSSRIQSTPLIQTPKTPDDLLAPFAIHCALTTPPERKSISDILQDYSARPLFGSRLAKETLKRTLSQMPEDDLILFFEKAYKLDPPKSQEDDLTSSFDRHCSILSSDSTTQTSELMSMLLRIIDAPDQYSLNPQIILSESMQECARRRDALGGKISRLFQNDDFRQGMQLSKRHSNLALCWLKLCDRWLNMFVSQYYSKK